MLQTKGICEVLASRPLHTKWADLGLTLTRRRMLDYQAELLREVKHKYSLSKEVCQAYQALPRHKFLTKFSPDNVSWLSATPENLPFIYGDNSLLLYQRQGQIATISQPSFALRMLDLLDLKPQLRAFEVGTGSGWNAALMGYLVGRRGQIKSWEIIPTQFLKKTRPWVRSLDFQSRCFYLLCWVW